MKEAVLEVAGLVKRYGDKTALAGIDLNIRAGEMVALLGPNGAGKSTLMQLLTGLFVADQGRIRVLGQDMRTDATRALASLGVVFQQFALDLDLSVRANLLFHTDLHGLPRRLALSRIDEGLEAVGLAGDASRPVRALSGGNRRRIELARAMLHRPRLLLMDEATVGLDPVSRRQLTQAVVELCRQHDVAALWTTHLVDEVAQADRVLVLHRGQVLFDGAIPSCLARTGAPDLESAFLQLTGPSE
ncbi:MAG: Daunorubicin/doxorubicin resistance ATP-binding protein DrrA [Pseudomonadota bacterium]|jgi:ABC-2 type transport system ATP-binding protein